MHKLTICVDFDGVLHSYTSGWKGIDVVADPPVPGAIEWLIAMHQDFDLQIYSSRSSEPAGIYAMKSYLLGHLIRFTGSITQAEYVVGSLGFPLDKPKPFLTIDDRAICFDGTWPTAEAMRSFKPWNKR